MEQQTMSTAESNSADRLVSLLYILTSALRDEAGMPEKDACRIAESTVGMMSQRYGGEYLYCPKRHTIDRARRDDTIRSEWNGRNADDLMRRHAVSRTSLYRILAERKTVPSAP